MLAGSVPTGRKRSNAPVRASATRWLSVRVYDSLIELMGDTPLVRLRRVSRGVPAQVLAKVEYFNPGGSVNARIALRTTDAAERPGERRPGAVLVRPTPANAELGRPTVPT